MRLLIVDREFPPNPHGGIGSYDQTLAHLLGQRGHFVAVLSVTEKARLEIREESFGVLIRVPYKTLRGKIPSALPWINHALSGYQLAQFIPGLMQKYRIDLIELPSSGGYNYFIARQKNIGIPVISRFHGALGKIPIMEESLRALNNELRREKAITFNQLTDWIHYPSWFLESQQLARSDSITFPSQFSLHWLKKQVPRIDEMRMQFIPNGVDVKLLASFKPKIHQRENIACFVGRCSIPKGISVLVRAIPQIFENDPDLKFNIVGPMINSKIRSKLIFLSEKYPGRIQLLGRMTRDQLMPLFAKSSFLVHPSFYETSSIAIMEAMALGLPVVASNIMPLPEIVQDCETGILVEPGNSVHLANAVLKLARLDSDTIIQMREASKAKIYKNYNLNQIASQLILFYEQAISENSCYLSGTQSQGE